MIALFATILVALLGEYAVALGWWIGGGGVVPPVGIQAAGAFVACVWFRTRWDRFGRRNYYGRQG